VTTAGAHDAHRAVRAAGLLREFNAAGVLAPADVHVARRLAELAGEDDEWVALAAALAVRAPRLGHVYVDLATIHRSATVDAEDPVDLTALPWPPADAWPERLHASPLVAVGEEGAGADRPLRLVGTALYLDRYWREERRLAADLRALRDSPLPAADADGDRLAERLARLSGDAPGNRQRLAARAALTRRFAVVAGGPGTGKTTTVAMIVALLYEQAAAAGAAPPLVALAAPTGKAAARLVESVHEEAGKLAVDDDVRARLEALDASTLHRLLGWRPGTHSRFRHDRANRLPHDVVIVDETSMVALSLMARLVEAIRADARLVLVGDPGQLTSIEAGAVLGDIVASSDEGTVVLDRVFRYGRGIDRLAEAVRAGDADAVLEGLAAVTWIAADAADAEDALGPVRDAAVASARAVREAAAVGAGAQAIAALGGFRVLCAHRRGDHGVAAWTARIEAWLADELPGFGAEGDWYVGRPLLVTQNDYGLRLFNGDTGVVVASGGGRVAAAFERGGEVVELSPTRLAAVDTVYAMTVHKSQGSQLDTAAVVLPDPGSPILTRELLYTAVTRARRELILVGTEEAIRAAVARPVARASGLRWRLAVPYDRDHG